MMLRMTANPFLDVVSERPEKASPNRFQIYTSLSIGVHTDAVGAHQKPDNGIEDIPVCWEAVKLRGGLLSDTVEVHDKPGWCGPEAGARSDRK